MEWLKNLLDKWSCKHDWKMHHQNNIFVGSDSERPYEVRQTLICNHCGKVKKITL